MKVERNMRLQVSLPPGMIRSMAEVGPLAIAVNSKREQLLRETLERRPYSYNELDPAVAYELTERWQQPCEAMFEFLAANHPHDLLALLHSSRLSSSDLTYAAEIAGTISDSALVRPILAALLEHPQSVVREGAVYGLARHLDAGIRSRLQAIAASDPSRGVRTAAQDTLASD